MSEQSIDEVFGDEKPRKPRGRPDRTPMSRWGARLLEILTRRRMTELDLATALGCSAQNVSGLLRTKTPQRRTVERIAHVLECSERHVYPAYNPEPKRKRRPKRKRKTKEVADADRS